MPRTSSLRSRGAGNLVRRPVAFGSFLASCLLSAIVPVHVSGCQSGPPGAVAAQAEQNPTTTRLQKVESESRKTSGGSLLDLASYQAAGPNDSQVAARIRATVNGIAILDEEVREVIYPYLLATQGLPEPERSTRRKEIFERELQQIIEREIILQDMFARLKDRKLVLDKLKEAAGKEFDKKMQAQRKRLNIKTDEEFKAALRNQGLTLEGIRRQVERNFMAMEYMHNRIQPALERVSHQQILDYYRQHPEEFQIADSVTWQDIFIDAGKFSTRDEAHQFAEQLAARARRGEDFHKLVMSFDNGDSSYRNGEGYGRKPGEIKPVEAEPVLFRMRDGEIGPVIELTNGFHVIRVVKREYAGVKPFDEKTQASIRDKLQKEAWEKEYKRLLAELKRGSAVEISTGTP
jgi:parvulin-like peptidyl-prolyl isomerase